MPSRTPTLPELLNRLADKIGADLRVALPGVVTKYDASKQLADIKPQIKDSFEQEDGSLSDASLPVISNVPVAFFGGGGFRMVFPIRAGDTGLLVFGDRSLDAWLDQGGETAPKDQRRHHLTDGIFFPGLHPNNKAWSDAAGEFITLGSDSGSADFVALAAKVDAALSAIKAHVHASFGTPSASLVSMGTATGSATVKVKG